jgi:mono/diheme cytochrome c family protein
MKKYSETGILLIISIIALVACSGNGTSGLSNSSGSSQSGTVDQMTPPDNYSGLTNPLKKDEATLNEGKELYQANCSSCHGSGGEGDGPASGGLNPMPQNLAENQSQLSDSYLFWRISEGGLMDPFYSLMPAWRGLLDEEEIWQIITYVRTMGS